MTAPIRVAVIGAGPAGLAAAARVLEQSRGRHHVRLLTMGHHVGGKADSWRDSQGRIIEHGQHVVVGWYREMKALLGRAGVDVDACLVDNRGHTHVYEPRDGKVHDLALRRNPLRMLLGGLGYSGLTRGEKWNLVRFVTANLATFLGAQDLEQFDDVCFTGWCLANGLAPSIVQTSAFRMSRTAQLNWPGEISAYSMLAATRRIGRDYRTARYAFCDGGMSERFWQPVLRYITGLGGQFEPMRKLVGLRHAGGRVTRMVLAEPDSGGHERPDREPGRSPFEHQVPVKPESQRLDDDFDHVISTLPATALQQVDPDDRSLWELPGFAAIRELRGIAPLALQIWHRERVTRRYPSVIAGLDGPLGFVLDNKPIVREYRDNPRYGAVLYFVGQETGYTDRDDQALLDLCLANVANLPGYERIDRAGVMHFQVIRNRSVDKLYFDAEPGVQKFRPHTRTALANLWLAGDWVRSEIDFPCMEAAVRSGRAAADAVLAAGRR